MRVWVRPDTLSKLQITVTDVVNSVKAQNVVNPAGQIGAEPAPKGQEFTYTGTVTVGPPQPPLPPLPAATMPDAVVGTTGASARVEH